MFLTQDDLWLLFIVIKSDATSHSFEKY
ncbi:uncharacterized protein METZ01_LOCUS453686, partial [marine metagenome]